MADYQSTRAAGIAAVDELDKWQGQPTLSSELASLAQVTKERDDAVKLAADRKGVIDGMLVDLNEADTADAAEEAADDAGDAARAAAKAKAEAAP